MILPIQSNPLIVLQPPYHYPGRNALFVREPTDACGRKGATSNERLIGRFWDQEVARKLISFLFFLIYGWLLFFDKNISSTMMRDVASFMKESKPEVIVCLVS